LVIVPVYNAREEVRTLIESLARSVPAVEENLSFVFANDGSTDAGMRAVWTLPFFAREDVALYHNERNLGFVDTVNRCIARASPRSDIVLLNSDTMVFGNLFGTLQEEAYSAHRIASVTPLTNNGTIASLFNFPSGHEMPPLLEPEEVAQAVQSLNLSSPQVWAPTGVGFCVYLRRKAISKFGLFDPIYGRGYGEETDWCQKARANGWRHLISTRCFVYHSGTKSFLNSYKSAAIKRNSEHLLSRYPNYHSEVRAYCARNPTKFHRLRILLEVLKRHSRGEMFLFALHSDPDARCSGGTERHVRQLHQIAAAERRSSIEIFPQAELFRIRGFYGGTAYFDETVEQIVAEPLFALLAESIEVLHVHHVSSWSENAIDSLVAARFRKKLLTLHDFFFLCPSVNLLCGEKGTRFCEVEADLVACNRCLKNDIQYRTDSIEEYRTRACRRLAAFDRIVVPSRAMLQYWEKALAVNEPELFKRIEVFEHDLSHIVALRSASKSCRDQPLKPLIAFVGLFRKRKGSELIVEAASQLRSAGFEVAIVGDVRPESYARLANIQVTNYRTLPELADWLQQNEPMIVVHPSLTAESFCYAFYECVLLSKTAIPVVGLYGNPAELIRETGAGVVMAEMSCAGLLAACEHVRKEQQRIAIRRAQFREALQQVPRDYRKEYFALVDRVRVTAGIDQTDSVDLVRLEAREFLLRRMRRFRTMGRSLVGRFFDRVPVLKNILKRFRDRVFREPQQADHKRVVSKE
jgi:GT2 family glycosyltransferase/glycosyltransferase involved in cell wall biosynthesis